MAVDTKLEQELKNHITLLEKLQERVVQAIEDAKGKFKEVEAGKSREQVFPRKK
jgi:hypothetical protein